MQRQARVINKKITWQEIPIMFKKMMVLPDVYGEVWSAFIPFPWIHQVDHGGGTPKNPSIVLVILSKADCTLKSVEFDPAQKWDPNQREYDLPPFAEVRQKLFCLTPWFALC